MGIRGTNQETSQSANRALVLQTLQHIGECSRVELARQTGLKQATISHIMTDFIDWGLVEETGAFSGNKGRRTIGVRLSDRRYRVIGFRLTRQHYSIGVFSLNGVETRERVFVNIGNASPERILEEACAAINRIIGEDGEDVCLAVGAAVPGPYYKDSGEIAMISDFSGWRDIPIRDIMRARIGIPVIVEHDANAGALAESILAPGRDMYGTMVYVSAGQGIGAGIIHNGEIYSGAMGIAGEIGHTCIDIHGPRCECGRRGCLTLYASTIALTRGVIRRLGGEELSFQDAAELIRAGKPEALDALSEMMEYLGAGIIDLIFCYNPGCIVIGDEISAIGQPILDALNAHLREMNVSQLAGQVKLELAGLGNDSAYAGSAVVAARHVFANVASMVGRETAACHDDG